MEKKKIPDISDLSGTPIVTSYQQGLNQKIADHNIILRKFFDLSSEF